MNVDSTTVMALLLLAPTSAILMYDALRDANRAALAESNEVFIATRMARFAGAVVTGVGAIIHVGLIARQICGS